jgi:hypothetical protein
MPVIVSAPTMRHEKTLWRTSHLYLHQKTLDASPLASNISYLPFFVSYSDAPHDAARNLKENS